MCAASYTVGPQEYHVSALSSEATIEGDSDAGAETRLFLNLIPAEVWSSVTEVLVNPQKRGLRADRNLTTIISLQKASTRKFRLR